MEIEGEIVSNSCFLGQHYSSGAVVCRSSLSLEGHGLSHVRISSSSSYSKLHLLTDLSLEGWEHIRTVTWPRDFAPWPRENSTSMC